MPNDVTVPVTVEQLHLFQMWLSDEHEPSCDSELQVNIDCSCHRSKVVDALDVLLCRSERIAEWRKNAKVGDRVRLKAMPETKGEIANLALRPVDAWVVFDNGDAGWRYLAELMPEEE